MLNLARFLLVIRAEVQENESKNWKTEAPGALPLMRVPNPAGREPVHPVQPPTRRAISPLPLGGAAKSGVTAQPTGAGSQYAPGTRAPGKTPRPGRYHRHHTEGLKMQMDLAKLVHTLRTQQGLTETACKQIPGKRLTEHYGFKSYRGLKRDFDSEVARQFNRVRARCLEHGEDALLAARRTRPDRVKRIYLERAEFAGNYTDRDKGDMRFVADYDGKRRMAVIRVDSWVQYSFRYGTYRKCAGLVLFDEDAQEYRFLRIGPDIETVEDALEYIKPAAVKKAGRNGLRVRRQGDMYFVPQRTWNLSALRGSNHEPVILGNRRIILHETHPDLVLETPHRAYQQMLVRNAGFGPGGRQAGHGD